MMSCDHAQVEVPLNTAKKLILLSADKYDTVFSTNQYVSGWYESAFLYVVYCRYLSHNECTFNNQWRTRMFIQYLRKYHRNIPCGRKFLCH